MHAGKQQVDLFQENYYWNLAVAGDKVNAGKQQEVKYHAQMSWGPAPVRAESFVSSHLVTPNVLGT